MSEQRETPAPASATQTGEPHQTNGIDSTAPVTLDSTANSDSAGLDSGVEEAPVVRMRNTPANMNGQQMTANGQAAVQRGLEVLAETESAQNCEEIKKLDTQLDHFNKYLDKFEKKNSELTERLSTLLNTQKEERVKRRASFMQREEELKAEQDSFDNQLRNMFAKCAQMRRTPGPVIDNGIESMLEQSRRIREGPNETPIHEANGHEEAEAAPTN